MVAVVVLMFRSETSLCSRSSVTPKHYADSFPCTHAGHAPLLKFNTAIVAFVNLDPNHETHEGD